jgi:UDP:flavonoid glycosyltransferase YjiC (YdhE family)
MEGYLNIKNERILFSPLNWGWGHVSRSIAMLQVLIENYNHVTIACTDEHREIYKEYLENVDFISWEGYPFRFRGKGNFGLDLFLSLKDLRRFGKNEQNRLDTLQAEKKITIILSENRYFFRSVSAKSIFITHQVSLPLPWYLSMV